VGLYINKPITYKRRDDLEIENLHLIIIDVKSDSIFCIISLYRPFKTPDGSLPLAFFRKQIATIKSNILPKTLVLDDFNLDSPMQ
jgi:hypothetical protein